MAEHKLETPNGCRIFHGRCFESLTFDPASGTVYAIFHDGSEYRYFGLDPVEANEWIAMLDPGCFFNHHIWPGQFEKIKGPN